MAAPFTVWTWLRTEVADQNVASKATFSKLCDAIQSSGLEHRVVWQDGRPCFHDEVVNSFMGVRPIEVAARLQMQRQICTADLADAHVDGSNTVLGGHRVLVAALRRHRLSDVVQG